MGVTRRRLFWAPERSPWRGPRRPQRAQRPRIVIAGAGFAGSCCALQLRRLNPAIHVMLIDPVPLHHLPDEQRGDRGRAHAAVSDRDACGPEGRRCRVPAGEVIDFDPARRRVRLAAAGRLRYDRLVIAPGIRMLHGQPEGYDEAAARLMPHAWVAGTLTATLGAYLARLPTVPPSRSACPRGSCAARLLPMSGPASWPGGCSGIASAAKS